MDDWRDAIRKDENALQQLMEAIPGFDGYREREIRRTADKILREHLVSQLDVVRDRLNEVIAAWARAGRLQDLDDIDRVARKLAKVRDNIRFADYGYTGFFDAIKIGEEQLDRLYAYDLSLSQGIADCAKAVQTLSTAPAEQAAQQIGAAEAAVASLQTLVDRRAEVTAAAAAAGEETHPPQTGSRTEG
jgi:hypothetical protein